MESNRMRKVSRSRGVQASEFRISSMQGGWTGTFVSLAGGILFTLGSMSHHNTYEATDATWGLTLFSAAIAAALAQKYYQKAIVGVAGKLHPRKRLQQIVTHTLPAACGVVKENNKG